MKLIQKEKAESFIYFGIFLLWVFVVWKINHNFPISDDWAFLEEFSKKGFSDLFEPYFGHVAPLFKGLYFIEVMIFGVNMILFHYVNLFVFAVTAFVLYKFLENISNNRLLSLFAALLFAAHPVNKDYILWSFQIGQTAHILFQLLFVRYIIKYSEEKNYKFLSWAVVFLLLQNYFLGNGIFMPCLLLAVGIIYKEIPKRYFIIGLAVFLQLLFFAVQITKGNTSLDITPGNIPEIVYSIIYFGGRTILRIFLFYDFRGSQTMAVIAFIIFLGLAIHLFLNNKNKRNWVVLFTIWFFLTIISIPLVRSGIIYSEMMPYYYSAFSVLPVLIIVFLFFHSFIPKVSFRLNSALKIIGVSILVILFIINQRFANSISVRNVRNNVAMEIAIESGTGYKPYDDPFFRDDSVTRIRNLHPLDMYNYWKSRTPVFLFNKQLVK